MKKDVIPDAGGGSGVQRTGGKTGPGCRITLGATTKYIYKKKVSN
jgi:hypothetical protein